MNVVETIHRIVDYLNAYIWQGIPVILKGFIIALIFVLIFRKQLKARPVAFYIYPALYLLWGILGSVSNFLVPDSGLGESWVMGLGSAFEELGLGCDLGIGLIIIVMFIGVLPKTTLVKNLFAIRTEMSIIGATLLVGHGLSRLAFAIGFIPTDARFEQGVPIIFSFIYFFLGLILMALLILPWITSFRPVRKKMSDRTWKKLQTYFGVPLFIVMLVFGLVLNLAWSVGWYPDLVDMGEITAAAWDGTTPISLGDGANFATWLLSAKIYAILLVSYIILRIKKVRNANRSSTNLPTGTSAAE
jgi:DMSO/TMAO reductase YedYZ heme-binding membrane subunit